jgi:hypothetical protein
MTLPFSGAMASYASLAGRRVVNFEVVSVPAPALFSACAVTV